MRPSLTDAPFLLLAGGYFVAVAIVSALWDFSLPSPISYLGMPIIFACVTAVCVGPVILFLVFRDRPQSIPAYLWDLAAKLRTGKRLRIALPVLVGVTLLSHTFSAVKSAIPLIADFTVDPALIRADVALHGKDPWRLLQPVFGYPIVTFVLSWVYQFWFFVMVATTVLASLMIERPRLRAQYFIAYALCWILLGTVAATWLASVGPCFYEVYYGDDYFTPLMTYLRSVNGQFPLPTLAIQEGLLEWASNRENGLGRGISAMPSLHIALCVLFSLFAWSLSRAWGIAATIFLALIFVGSIHLAYHYALDSYISIIVTPVIWWAAGGIAKVFQDRSNGEDSAGLAEPASLEASAHIPTAPRMPATPSRT